MGIPLATGVSEGITALGDALTFLSGNSIFSTLLSVAIAGVVVSVALGLFFRR